MIATELGGLLPAYGGWAALYQRYRPRYPAPVFDLLEKLSPSSGLCVELGAGSGQATGDLLRRFDRVIAIEPDAQMAERIPADPGLEVRVQRAEDATLPFARADAVVVATALHWMDQERVAQLAADWLKPGGIAFVFGYAAAQYPGSPPSVTEVAMRYARLWRSHMHERLSSWRPYSDALRAAGVFAEVRTFEVYADHVWSPEEAAGFLLTTSYGQSFAQSTGDPEGARRGLAADLTAATGGKPITVRFPIEGAYARTPAAV